VAIRLTRNQQVERNRALLLDAARTVFLERGYAGATLDAIAEEAGFSKGVVYSQFAGKPDLLLALLEHRIADRAEGNARVVESADAGEALRTLMRGFARDSLVEAGWARLLIEFRVVAARDARLNARYARLHDLTLDRLAATLGEALSRDGRAAVLPVRALAQLVLAMGSGAVLEQAADPAALPVDVLERLVDRLTDPA